MALGPREKRETDRIQPFVTPCKVIDGERTLSAYLTDLSTRGARISSNASLGRGAQSVVIQVRLSRGSAVCKLPARIQWMQAGGKPGEAAVFGVTFEGVPAEVQKQLEHVVKEFRRRAALLTSSPVTESPQSRRQGWKPGPNDGASDLLTLSDDELLFRIEALPGKHDSDHQLLEVVRSDRHFFVRQEAAKRIRDAHLLRDHSGDRHIGQVLVRGMTRSEDQGYLEKLVAESRHLEVRKAAEAQLRMILTKTT